MSKTVKSLETPSEITPLVSTLGNRPSCQTEQRTNRLSAISRTTTMLKRARQRYGPQDHSETVLDKVCSELEENEKKGNRFFWVSLFFIANHIAGGAITLHYLEGWTFSDAAYFCIVTITTVGYGDITPKSAVSKIFVIYYVVVSIALISTMLAYLIGILIDQQEEILLSAITQERESDDESEGAAGDDVRLQLEEHEAAERIREATQRLDKSDWYNLIMALISLLLVLFAGFAIFFWGEKLTIVDAIYTTVISATTVGFGDFEPTNDPTKIAMTIWLCFSTIAVGKVIADFTDASVKAKQRDVSRRLLTSSMDIRSLQSFDMDKSGAVEKSEFLTEMLVRSGKVEREEIETILLRFEQLDKDKSGAIGVMDVLSS